MDVEGALALITRLERALQTMESQNAALAQQNAALQARVDELTPKEASPGASDA